MQGHTLSNYLVIQIFFKYINIVLLMMILFISIFVKKYFKMIFVNYHLWINNAWNYYTVQIFIMHLLFTVIILNKKNQFLNFKRT